MPGNVDGPDSSSPGKAGWPWYTGSAAWLNRVSLEWILGVRPEWGGLRIDPCPFASMGRVTATRLWRGRTVRITFDATEHSASLPPKLTINSREHAGNLVRADEYASDKELNIAVSWGLHVKPGVVAARTGAAAAGQHAHQDRRD